MPCSRRGTNELTASACSAEQPSRTTQKLAVTLRSSAPVLQMDRLHHRNLRNTFYTGRCRPNAALPEDTAVPFKTRMDRRTGFVDQPARMDAQSLPGYPVAHAIRGLVHNCIIGRSREHRLALGLCWISMVAGHDRRVGMLSHIVTRLCMGSSFPAKLRYRRACAVNIPLPPGTLIRHGTGCPEIRV